MRKDDPATDNDTNQVYNKMLPLRLHPATATGLFLALLLALIGAPASAQVAGPETTVDAMADSLSSAELQYLIEEELPLSLEAVLALQEQGNFLAAPTDVLSLGIGANPVWVHLALENNQSDPVERVIIAGATWINRIDFHAVHDGQAIDRQVAGDASPNYRRATPGVGNLFRLAIPPGRTDIFLRAESPDPLVFPVKVMTPEAARQHQEQIQYSYGAVYGFLLALLCYNFMLWLGLRRSSHRDYSIYLGTFIAMNMAYTGHGYAWLWPAAPGFQQYVILVLMVLFAVAGLNFARGFLDLPRHSPRLARYIQLGSLGALVLMAALVTLQHQTLAALLAFSVAITFTLVMFMLGWLAVVRGYTAARYFVIAAFSGVIGVGTTTVTVWSWVPYTQAGFRAVEIGLLIEATLLALAVAYLVREHDAARRRAERLARIDSLTGLLNRRALVEQGSGLWNIAQRSNGQLSLILIDLDHFKRVNDTYGHDVGDKVLMETATMIREVLRKGDLAARWGGEEFLLLLPGAGRHEALSIAERLRDIFANRPLSGHGATIKLQASFGVATLDEQVSLSALIKEADDYLYRAKQQGRDRICSAEGLPARTRSAV